MNLQTAINVLGIIPGVGIPIGIGRICVALHRARQQKVNTVAGVALAAVKHNTRREIFHGFCEIVPLFGPLLYGALKLYQRCAKKANNQGQNILGVAANGAPIAPPAAIPTPTPQVTAQPSVLPRSIPLTAATGVPLAPPVVPVQPPIVKIIPTPAPISLEGVTTCASLIPYIGKKIAINVFPNAVANEHLKGLKKTPEVLIYEGVLKSVSEILANGTHLISLDRITCRIPSLLPEGPVDLMVSDAELAEANKADREEVTAKGLSELLGED
jgi:hypothetical protein